MKSIHGIVFSSTFVLATNPKHVKCIVQKFIFKIIGQATLCVKGFVAVLLCLTMLPSFTSKQRQMPTQSTVTRVTHYLKWKEVEQFPGNFVSNTGLVRYKHCFLKPRFKGRSKYAYVIFMGKSFLKGNHIHRLVWQHFGDQPFKKGWQLHHKDGNVLNNHIDNLEYLPAHEHVIKHNKIPNKYLPA